MVTNKVRIAGRCAVMAAVALLVIAATGCQQVPRHLQRSHGIRFYETGDYARADARLTVVVEDDTTDWKAMYYLGLVRLKQNRPLDAELLLERAWRMRDESAETPDILDALAESMFRQNNTASLYALLDGATTRYGNSRDYLRKGKYMGLSGDPDGAKTAFERAFSLADPKDPDPYVAAADFYESIGDVPNAKVALRRAHYVAPSHPVIRERLRQHGIIPGPTAGLPPATTTVEVDVP